MTSVGLTGGIGSGKSSVLEVWRQCGAYTVRADQLAKKLMKTDPELKRLIRKHFGNKAYDQYGELNRQYLSTEAFQEGRVETLNKLVHPRVRKETNKLMEEAREQGYEVFVKEAALLLIEGRPRNLDYIVVVQADSESRKQWVAERDNISVTEVEERMKRQQSDRQMVQLADFVLANNGTIEQLQEQARQLYKKISGKGG